MKKLLSLSLTFAMCASLAACGGGSSEPAAATTAATTAAATAAATTAASDTAGPSDEQLKTLTDAYNQVADLYNEVLDNIEANGWVDDEQTMNDVQIIGATMDPIGQALAGDLSALEGADFDALPDAVLEYLPALEEISKKVAVPYEGGSDEAGSDAAANEADSDVPVVTDEALKPLANAYNELAPIYNEVYTNAEANGWLADEQTVAELDAVGGMLTYIASGLSDDPSKLEDADLDGLVEQLKTLSPEIEKIGERVSVPYGK